MGKIIFALLFIVITLNLKAQYDVSKNSVDSIIWVDNALHDFGVIIQGEQVRHKFNLKNLSKDTLRIISNERPGSSSHSIFTYSREKILPNSFFDVQVSFISSGREGIQKRIGSILLSNGLRVELGFKCNVISVQSKEESFKIQQFGYSVIKDKKVKDRRIITYSYKFINTSSDTFKIVELIHSSSIILINKTATLYPYEIGEILLEYSLKKGEQPKKEIVGIVFNNNVLHYFELNLLNNSKKSTKKKIKH
jgi:hypothetical protein